MNIKFLLFLAILVAAGYYAVEVKGINPFAKKIADDQRIDRVIHLLEKVPKK